MFVQKHKRQNLTDVKKDISKTVDQQASLKWNGSILLALFS